MEIHESRLAGALDIPVMREVSQQAESESGGLLFRVVGVTAVVLFFSPFVMIYLSVKAYSKIASVFHIRSRTPREVVQREEPSK